MGTILKTEIHVNESPYKFKDDFRKAIIAPSKDILCDPCSQEFDYVN